jgi:hypothetical protein
MSGLDDDAEDPNRPITIHLCNGAGELVSAPIQVVASTLQQHAPTLYHASCLDPTPGHGTVSCRLRDMQKGLRDGWVMLGEYLHAVNTHESRPSERKDAYPTKDDFLQACMPWEREFLRRHVAAGDYRIACALLQAEAWEMSELLRLLVGWTGAWVAGAEHRSGVSVAIAGAFGLSAEQLNAFRELPIQTAQ